MVSSHFGLLASLDGDGRAIGCLKEDSFLDGRGNANVKSNFASVHPIANVDVRGAREGSGDEARHFLERVERRVLSRFEDGVSNSVVTAAFEASIIPAMEGVVPHLILGHIA